MSVVSVAKLWNVDALSRRRQMSGVGSQQGTSALFHKDSGKPERTAGMSLRPPCVLDIEIEKEINFDSCLAENIILEM